MVVVIDLNFGSLLIVLLLIVMNMVCVLFVLMFEEVLCGGILYVVKVFGFSDRGEIKFGKLVDLMLWDIEFFVELVYIFNGYCFIKVFLGG